MIDPHKPNFGGSPASPWRPRLSYAPEDPGAEPAVSVVTPFCDAGHLFRETVDSMMNQTFQQWEWIVANDGSVDPASRSILDALRSEDPRIRIVDHDRKRGQSAARNTGLKAASTEFVYQLDQGDLLEPTALEKTFWCLISHPEYSFVNSWSVLFGIRRSLWSKGFDVEERFLESNFAIAGAMIRKPLLDDTGGYAEVIGDGLECWDFWLRCADRRRWGITIPEYLDWHRLRESLQKREASDAFQAFRGTLRDRYPRLFRGAFPKTPSPKRPGRHSALEELPCANRLTKRKRRLLMIAPYLNLEGTGAFNVQLAQLLVRQGWEVAAVAGVGDDAWARALSRSTPDTHILSRFLPPDDQPRFLWYLIQSRQPDVVLFNHGAFANTTARYLQIRCPEPVYVELCHEDPNDPSDTDFPRSASRAGNVFDFSVVSSRHLERSAIEAGGDPARVKLVYPSVDTTVWKPRMAPRGWLREQWGAEPSDTVILFAADLSTRNQPHVLARTVLELARRKLTFRAIVVGDGERKTWLESYARTHELEPWLRFIDRQLPDMVLKIMAASDVFFLPSAEGFALSLLQAMAVGLVVVSADVGGQAELVTPDCGFLIDPGDARSQVRRYVDILERLASETSLRRRLSRGARNRVLTKFGPDRTLGRLVPLLQEATQAPRTRPQSPEPRLALEEVVACMRRNRP